MKKNQSILVVENTDYIGSHCVKELLKQGYNPVVLDVLSSNHKGAVPRDTKFYEANLDWEPKYVDVMVIIELVWAWYKTHPNSYNRYGESDAN